MRRDVIGLIVAAILTIGAVYSGLPEWLGAHPKFAEKIAIGGALSGAVLAVLVRYWRAVPVVKAGLAGLALFLAFTVAKVGGNRFAASFAEDAFAGKMWFFGWIATGAAGFLVVFLLFGLLMPRRA